MNNNKSSSLRMILLAIVVLVVTCICLTLLGGVGYWLYLQQQTVVTMTPAVTEEAVLVTTPSAQEGTPVLEGSGNDSPSATPESLAQETVVATEAPATLPLVEPTEPATFTPTPTATATPLEPTLLPTETATPTRPAGPGIPAPRLTSHTSCQTNISQFGRESVIEFTWTWTGRVDTAAGNYLEVRIGPRGATNLSSMGAINNDALRDPAQNRWSVSIGVPTFYRDTANDYEWQVAYMNNNQRLIVASGRGCFNIR